jgi:hypothetical protein
MFECYEGLPTIQNGCAGNVTGLSILSQPFLAYNIGMIMPSMLGTQRGQSEAAWRKIIQPVRQGPVARRGRNSRVSR